MSMPKLSPQEQKILWRLVRGESRAQVAHSMGISEYTIQTHLRNVRLKLQASTTLQAVAITVAHKLNQNKGSK
jgi:DNA-binding CsgD family transcriptional regulator